jgi:uncharacterized phage protein (TIGR01671 family)
MRDFKFRTFNKKTNKMYYVERIDFDRRRNIDGITLIDRIDIPHPYKLYITDLTPVTLSDLSTMQYIGRKDKKEKEIYEDDILKTRWQWGGITNYEFETTGKVFYSTEHAAFRIYIKDNFSRPFHDCPNEKLLSMEVIGNTYENPELFKGEPK